MSWIKYEPKSMPKPGREPAVYVGGKSVAVANQAASEALKLDKNRYTLYLDGTRKRMGLSVGTSSDVFKAGKAALKGAYRLILIELALKDMGLWPEKRTALPLYLVKDQPPVMVYFDYSPLEPKR